MEIEFKKSRVIMLLISIIISILSIIGWVYFTYNVIYPWWKATQLDGLTNWTKDLGVEFFLYLVPILIAGLLLIMEFILLGTIPIGIFLLHIILVLCSIAAQKKWMIVMLSIHGFITLNIVSGITAIIILKDNNPKAYLEQ